MFAKSFFQSPLPVPHHGDEDRSIAVSAGCYQKAFSGVGDGEGYASPASWESETKILRRPLQTAALI